MSGPTLNELIDRDPIPAPPLPFEVVDDDGYIFIRRRDGKHYRPFEPMGVNPEEYRGKCEWLCELLNDVYYYGALAEIKRAREVDRKSAAAFLDAMADLTKTITQAAE